MKYLWLTAACVFLLMIMPVSVAHAEDFTEKEFQKLCRQLKPSADEAWRTIPWKISLLDAQKTAAQEKKPIFIWAMDGHPLGCT